MTRSTVRALLRTVLLAMVAICTTGPGVAAAQTQPEGSIGIRLLDAPTDRADDPRAQAYIVDHVNAGDRFARHVELRNTSGQPIEVAMYAGASRIENGRWAPLDGRAENDLTSWISVGPGTLVVPAGSTAQAKVRVAVADDAPAGEHYAVVWAELPGAIRDGVRVVNRVGIRVYLSVGPGAEPPGRFSVTSVSSLRRADGSLSLLAVAENRGSRALDVTASVGLADGPAGSAAGPFQTPRSLELAPGTAGLLAIDLPADLPDGVWTASLRAVAGRIVVTRTASLEFRSTPGIRTVYFDEAGNPVAEPPPGATLIESLLDASARGDSTTPIPDEHLAAPTDEAAAPPLADVVVLPRGRDARAIPWLPSLPMVAAVGGLVIAAAAGTVAAKRRPRRP